MDYQEAMEYYENEYIKWIYDNYPIYNGDMLIAVMEDGASFFKFMDECNPEKGEVL